MKRLVLAISALLLPLPAFCQMEHRGDMKHEAAKPSQSLLVTGLAGKTKTWTPDELKALPHLQVTVTNGHSHQQETYSGVPVKELLAAVAGAKAEGAPAASKVSPRTTVVIARGTDAFQVVLTLCDTDPGCRSGQAIVADSMDGHPLASDGTFKLILTEDKMPGRWVRNLDALTVKNIGTM